MNKKLFTLVTLGLLTAGSAFNGVQAQTTSAAAKTKLDGSTYFFLGDGANHYLIGEEVGTGANKYTKLKDASDISGEGFDLTTAMWAVKVVTNNGVNYVQLTNKKTQDLLRFDATGAVADAVADVVTNLTWAGLVDGDNPADGVVDYNTGGKLSAGTTGIMYIKLSDGHCQMDGDEGNGAAIKLYLEDSDEVKAGGLNSHLGNGFSFEFVGADPKPATNIFGQKLYAFDITTEMSDANTDAFYQYTTGTYFALTPKPATITNDNSADAKNWFLTTQFVAVSPTKHLGIPSLEQEDGVGFELVTVYGKDLKTTATKKSEVSSKNAAFTVVKPAPVNEPNNYAVSLNARVKKDASKDNQDEVPVKIVVTNVMGANYVTTGPETATAAKVKFSDTNLVAVKDILKKDGASVYNILFTSGADQTATNPTEYGKYLGIGGADLGILAQGPAYVNLNNAEMQWVITAADADNSTFTFTNREDKTEEFTTTLRKTEKENVYEIAADVNFKYAYVGNAGYTVSGNKKLKGKIVELKAATVDKTAGYANYDNAELSQLVKLQFSVGSAVLSKDIYVGAKVTAGDAKADLVVSQDIADAAQWEILKRTGVADTIYSKMGYAYLDKDSKVKTDKEFENHEIVTYSLRLYKDGKDFYYNGADALVPYDKLALAPHVAIKENVDGTISLINVGAGVDYDFAKVALGLKNDGTLVYGESVYAHAKDEQKSYLYFSTDEATPSLEAAGRHASFQSVNGGFLAVGAEGDAVIAATADEAEELTFWLDTTDVEQFTPSFYISKGVKAATKAAEARNYLFNAKDSVNYYDEGTASTITDWDYKLLSGETIAIFKAATLVNKDSISTVVGGEEVGLNNANGLKNFKFQIVLDDADVEDEYVIKSVADNKYLTNVNGKVAFTDNRDKAMVVNVNEGIAPTANEAIAAEGVQVIGGKGAVTVQGAAGKVITVANVLGQTIANQVAASDNVTIAAPAGIVVVAVEGEATKVVVK
ncbi:hypothetical protein JQM84_09330 [Parabacteroides distasonis]|nr:hypothetical protein [Parabacteroides distasonis]